MVPFGTTLEMDLISTIYHDYGKVNNRVIFILKVIILCSRHLPRIESHQEITQPFGFS